MIKLPKVFDRLMATMQKKAVAVIAIAVVLTSAAAFYSFLNFSIDADLSEMISEELPFRQLENDLKKKFPQLSDTIVIVIEGDTAEGTATARSRLAEGLRSEQKVFKRVFEPGGGAFFDRNGLLYLDIGRLQDVSDNVAAAQPLLALLSEELSLRNMFSVLNTVVENIGEMEIPPESMNRLFDEVADSFESVIQGKKKKISWQELMLDESGVREEHRQFIILKPYLKKGALFDASRPLDTIRRVAEGLALDASHGITVRTTGDIPLAHENLVTIQGNIGFATAASVLLVAIILTLAVGGSARLVAINLFTLAIGFIWTLAFAIAATGTLNLISITFGVLYIGLGIDFSLLFCLRYRELLQTGMNNGEAIAATARGVGKGLFLCAAAAAIGFYSFIPTAYAGASDLGLISGTGMFINLLANLILLPALLTVFPLKKDAIGKNRLSFLPLKKLASLPYRHCKAVACGAAFLALGSAAFLPRLSFDYNPLNLYNPASEPVVTARELFRDPDTSPWTISVVTETGEKARATAATLSRLKEVKAAVTIFDFVPEHQPEKLTVISDMALFMPPVSKQMKIMHASPADNLQALSLFADKLYRSDLLRSQPPNRHALRLYEQIGKFRQNVSDDRKGEFFSSLDSALLSNLPILLNRLNDSLQAGPVGLHNLPRELHEQYVSAEGAYRVQVFPRENISDLDALARFVTAVQKAAPTAIDAPVSIYESGKAVVSSFRQAAVYAVVAITFFLILQLRSFMAPLLILAPFSLAFLLTAASSVLLGIPLNFANIIVLPLLLGLGIDNDIHLLHRYRTEPPENGNLLETSTSRAVIFSTITNVAGFGTLSWMPHRGLASMGILLILCMGFLILSTIIVLPALIELVERRRRKLQER